MPRYIPKDWPAPGEQMRAAADFLARATSGRTTIVYHGDADGICAAAAIDAALRRRGADDVVALPLGKGQSLYDPRVHDRIALHGTERLIVIDAGSRGQSIVAGVPTLVVDHHQPFGFPPGAVALSSFGRRPEAPASLLAYALASQVAEVADREWLAVVGTVGDAGVGAEAPLVREGLKRYGRRATTEAVALLNAAKRSSSHDVETAFRVALEAGSPRDILHGKVAGVDKLRQYRQEVAEEVARAARTRPQFAGNVALLRFASPCQVHSLVAIRWARRLSDKIVIAANEGYLPGRVNFAVRTMLDVNLVYYLRGLGLGTVTGEYGYGHRNASGGSLAPDDFERLLRAVGFGEAERARAA